MADKKDITIIIPFHKYSEENEKLLERAIASVPKSMPILVVTTSEHEIKTSNKNVKAFIKEGETNFQAMVNSGVENISTKWFSILEFDDTYTNIWLDNALKYMAYKPEVSVFMFLEDIKDFNNDTYVGFGNDAAWASSFAEEIGYIDNDALNTFFDFYLTGSLFNRDDWNEVGGLKESMKLTFWYEFLLRLTHNGKKVYVVPKVGYNHYLGRNGSLTETLKNEMNADETQGWFEIAKREYFFKEDRNKTYNKEN